MATDVRYPIKRALEKLRSLDSDLRFMAFSDLNEGLTNELSKDVLSSDFQYTHSLCKEVLSKLSDPVTEVQNQAVKCLELLVRRINDKELAFVTKSLAEFLSEKSENIPIKLMATRGLISNTEVKKSASDIFNRYIVGFLAQLDSDSWSGEYVGILFDLIRRYGPLLSLDEVDNIQTILMEPLTSRTGLTQRRAISALGALSRYLTNSKWEALITFILDGLDSGTSSLQKALVILSGTISKDDPLRFKSAASSILDKLLKALALERIEGNGDEDEDEDDDDDSQNELELRDTILTTLEAFTMFQPDEVEPFISDILRACRIFAKYDPNYIGDDEDTETSTHHSDGIEDADESDLYEDDAEFDEDFSDDEDQSWKLRRSAAKFSSALCTAYPKRAPAIFDSLLQLTIERIQKEREETVQSVLVNALLVFISSAAPSSDFYNKKAAAHTQAASTNNRRPSDASMILLDSDPILKLSETASAIIKISLQGIEKVASGVSEMPDLYISVLDKLVNVIDDLNKDDLKLLVSKVYALSQTKPPYLAGILQLTKDLITRSTVLEIDGYMLKQLMSIVLDGVTDSYYKTVTESLNCCLTFLETISDHNLINEAVPLAKLEQTLGEKIRSASVDLETKEKSIKVLGALLNVSGALDADLFTDGCNILADILSNEALRTAALETIEAIVRGSADKLLALDWVCFVIDSALPLKNSSDRVVRLDALNVLDTLASKLGEYPKSPAVESVTENICAQVSNNIDLHIALSDYQAQDLLVKICTKVLPLAIDNPICKQAIVNFTLANLTLKDTASAATSVGISLSSNVSEEEIAANATKSSYITFSRDMVKLFKAVVEKTGGEPFASIKDKVIVTDLEAQAEAILISYNNDKERLNNIIGNIMNLGTSQGLGSVESQLTVIGYYGQQAEKLDSEVVVNLFSILSNEAQDQKVRYCAAQALGRVISHHIEEYLENLLKGLASSQEKKTNFLLVSLRQAILSAASSDNKGDYEQLVKASSLIWDTLFSLRISSTGADSTKSKASSGLDERELIAECLGSLSNIDSASFIESLRVYLQPGRDESNRATALEALRCSFEPLNRESNSETSNKFEEHILPIVLDILNMPAEASTSNPGMSQRTLSVLVAIIHKRPELLMNSLDKLFPYINRYTEPDPTLIQSVQMGPFKHKVDNGLDTRKAAFEAIYMLVDSVPEDILKHSGALDGVLSRVLEGLLDEHEIKVLCLFILGKLAHTDIGLLMSENYLSSLIEKLTALLNKKIKESAIKQEFEKQSETIRNIERTSSIISAEISESSGRLNSIEVQRWAEFCDGMATINKKST